MEWNELWAYFNRVTDGIKSEILRQLDLDNWLPTVSARVRIEVLKFAPEPLQRRYNVQAVPVRKTKSREQLIKELNRIGIFK